MKHSLLIAGLFFLFVSGFTGCTKKDPAILHTIVAYEEGRFISHPANRGLMYSWENEMVVLIGIGYHDYTTVDRHSRDRSRPTINSQARSLDGGLTWEMEELNEIPHVGGPVDFTHPDFALRFPYGGGDFFYSYDRARSWTGPVPTNVDIEGRGIQTRTDYIVQGSDELLAFFTTDRFDGREGRVAAVRTVDGGQTWEHLSWVSPEPREGFAIMPNSVAFSSTEILTSYRRFIRRENHRWGGVRSYFSGDGGRTWEKREDIQPMLSLRQCSPATLTLLDDGRVVAVYAVRELAPTPSRIAARISADKGLSWSEEFTLRQDAANWDIGYNVTALRPDGKIVTAYYYNLFKDPDHTPYRFVAATIFDPDEVF